MKLGLSPIVWAHVGEMEGMLNFPRELSFRKEDYVATGGFCCNLRFLGGIGLTTFLVVVEDQIL